jgi:hypothetical protein
LVSLRRPESTTFAQPSDSDTTYQRLEIFNISDEEDLKTSEDEVNMEEAQELESEVDQLMESENDDNGKLHIHVIIDIFLTARITRSP